MKEGAQARGHGIRVAYGQLVWQVLFYSVPLCLLIAMSLWITRNYQPVPALTFANYSAILRAPRYLAALGESLALGFHAANLAVFLGYPAAHALRHHVPASRRSLILVLFLTPWFSSYLVRVLACQAALSRSGLSLGPGRLLAEFWGTEILYTEKAVLIGLVSILLPVSVILIYGSLARLDDTSIAAAKNLGAGRFMIFMRLELPLAVPGLIAAYVFTSILAFSDFVSVSILGGNNTYFISTAIHDRIKISDWPQAAALGTMALGVASLLAGSGFALGSRMLAGVRKSGGARF